ncbi:MAG: cytidine/deoxycytidylate deaminase family protein [Candidatus Pacearchaeota archaeon]|nr:cytidine/deoxycytidylate deaminase family protein [Candidatus Pacearchaeota archaeon]
MEKLLDDLRKGMKRPNWDEYFMDIVRAVSSRATCDRGRTACVIVKDKRILCTGYVGSPIGLSHCDEVGHLYETRYDANGKKTEHCIRTIHAEQNAIAQAARYGIPIDGSTIYMKLEPCFWCVKQMINVGIKRVVCLKRYHGGELSRKSLKEAGVKLDVLSEDLEKYDNM